MQIFFDEIVVGSVMTFGEVRVAEEDVRDFRQRYAPRLAMEKGDASPQDQRAAAQAHVYALWSRMLAEFTADWPVLARIGQDKLRWYKTVYAGDTLNVRITFMTADAIDDDRGVLVTEHEVMNQNGELVMSLLSRAVLARREER